jgi:hypothetical protein
MAVIVMGCKPASEVRYPHDERQDVLNLVKESPIVLLGVVEQVGSSRWLPAWALLRRDLWLKEKVATIGVDAILRGEGAARESLVYYEYHASIRFGYTGPPLLRPKPGERRIFFAQRVGQVLRSECDVVDCTIQVDNGAHSGPRLGPRQDLGPVIAGLLLTPSREFEKDAFVKRLAQNASLAGHLASPSRTIAELSKLLTNSDADISDEACLVMAETYPGQSDCARMMLQRGPDVPAGKRERAREAVRADQDRTATIVDWLEQRSSASASLNKSDCEDIAVLSLHRAAAVRDKARALLSRCLP